MKVEKFWKSIIYKNGKLDEKQIMKELSDFSIVMEEVPKVYEYITGGLLSKITYPAETIIVELEERFYDKKITQDDIKDILQSKQTNSEKLKEIKDYFN